MLQLTPQHLAASAPSGDSQTPPVFRLSTRSEAADGTQVHLHYFNPQYGTAAASALLGVADDDDDTIVEWPHNKNYGDVPPCTPAEQFSPTLESARYETQGSYLDDLTLLSSQLPPLRRAESCPPALHLLEREDELVLDFLQHSLSDESGNESNGHTSVNDTDDSDDDSDDGYGTGTIRLQLVAGGKQGGVSLPLTDRTPDTSPSLPLDAKTVKVSLPTADGGVRVSKHSADADDIALGSARKRRHNGSQRGRSRPEHLDDSETGDSDARNDDDSGELGDTVESLGENAYLDEATRVVNAKLRPFRPAGASSSRRTLARVHQQGMHGSSNGVMTAQLADGSEAPLAMGTGLSCHQCKKRHRADAVIFCRLTCDLHALFDKEAAAATNGKDDDKAKPRMCKKKYCRPCLAKFYQTTRFARMSALGGIAPYLCPACIGVCVCAACKRVRQHGHARADAHRRRGGQTKRKKARSRRRRSEAFDSDSDVEEHLLLQQHHQHQHQQHQQHHQLQQQHLRQQQQYAQRSGTRRHQYVQTQANAPAGKRARARSVLERPPSKRRQVPPEEVPQRTRRPRRAAQRRFVLQQLLTNEGAAGASEEEGLAPSAVTVTRATAAPSVVVSAPTAPTTVTTAPTVVVGVVPQSMPMPPPMLQVPPPPTLPHRG